MEGTRVRRLEGRDIAAAIALTDLEAWGYLTAVRCCERVGFQAEDEVVRWPGGATAGAGQPGVRPVRRADLDGLVRMDATYFGSDRRALITRLAKEFANTFLVAERAGHVR